MVNKNSNLGKGVRPYNGETEKEKTSERIANYEAGAKANKAKPYYDSGVKKNQSKQIEGE